MLQQTFRYPSEIPTPHSNCKTLFLDATNTGAISLMNSSRVVTPLMQVIPPLDPVNPDFE
jgi:hypothetical protein